MNTKVDRIDHTLIINLYKKDYNVSAIVNETGISEHLVGKVLEINGYRIKGGTKIDRINHQSVYEMYTETHNMEETCKAFNVSSFIIRKILINEYGIKIEELRKPKKIDTLDHNSVIKDYSQNRDIEIIAKMYNVSVTTIDKILKKHGIVRAKKLFPSDDEIISTYHRLQHLDKTVNELNIDDNYIRKVLKKHKVKTYHGRIEIGDKFGMLVVTDVLEPKRTSGGLSKRVVLCRCECGNIKKYNSHTLRNKSKTNCGCQWVKKREDISQRRINENDEKLTRKEERKLKSQHKSLEKKERKNKQESRWEEKRLKIGDKINKLTILSNETSPGKSIKCTDIANVRCDCGKERQIKGTDLRIYKSCGCERYKRNNLYSDKEGQLMYARWKNMKKRCYNVMAEQYINYGMRGITICDRWMEPNGQGFVNFCVDMGPRPSEKYSIDRINNDGNYEPSNCQWATASQQSRNQRKRRRLSSPPIPF
jgi:hypothetical protein